eukprot:6389531-Ditylum_brightwellii.AAC.1
MHPPMRTKRVYRSKTVPMGIVSPASDDSPPVSTGVKESINISSDSISRIILGVDDDMTGRFRPIHGDKLYSFLEELRIQHDVAMSYCHAMKENGFDDIEDLNCADDQDLQAIGIKIGHVRRIKRAASSNNISTLSERLYIKSKMLNPSTSALESNICVNELEEKQDELSRQRNQINLHFVTHKNNVLNEKKSNEEFASTSINKNDEADQSISIDDIDIAKLKLRDQSERIRTLESQLAHAAALDSINIRATGAKNQFNGTID